MVYVSFSSLEGEYRRYLSEVRSLGSFSVRRHTRAFQRFRDFLKRRRIRSARRVSLDLAYEFLEGYASCHGCESVRELHGSVKHILRFLRFAQILPEDLSEQMIAPRVWKLADVPGAFSDKEVVRMLASLRAQTPYDHRERVVILLFLCHGLRIGEVTRLRRDDIDWERKAITVRERKNREPLVLPLMPRLARALREYLAHLRPEDCSEGRLLVSIGYRRKKPLTVDGVARILNRFLRRCGLEGCATRFRHTLATRLVNSGTSLEDIQALLGHQHAESTRIYAKVHWEALRELADNWSLLL